MRDTELKIYYVNKAQVLYFFTNNEKHFFENMTRGKQDKLIQCAHK